MAATPFYPYSQNNYSFSDISRMYSELASGNRGMLANTVFASPNDVSQYDSLASTAGMLRDMMTRRYMGEMGHQQMAARVASLSSSLGLGSLGSSMFRTLNSYNPSLATNMLGHHGGYEAMGSLLSFSGNMALARGRTMGGLTDPHQYARNMFAGAYQSELAYRNNFKSGTGVIDVGQTHGLSLQQAAYISGGVLSDSSNYRIWADKWRAATPEERKREGLDEQGRDIEVFAGGKGNPRTAMNSFNKQTKELTKEINGIVASISKMTGSFDEAVKFLQQTTKGKAFSAESKADEARKSALAFAMNMRVSAANAGVSAPEAYQAYMQTTARFAAANGFYSGTASAYNRGDAYAATASLAANGMIAKGMSREEAYELAGQQGEGYARGDAHRMAAIAGHLVGTGSLSMEEAKKIFASGDAMLVEKQLGKRFGGVEKLRALMGNRVIVSQATNEFSEQVAELDKVASSSMGQESARKGAKAAFEANLAIEEARMYGGKSADEIAALQTRAMRAKNAGARSLQVLMASGISEEQAKVIAERAERNDLEVDEIENQIADLGGNRKAYGEARMYETAAQFDREFGGEFGNITSRLKSLVGNIAPMVTQGDVDKKLMEYAQAEKKAIMQGMMADFNGAKDPRERDRMFYAITSKSDQALAGSDGMSYNSQRYVENLINGAGVKDDAEIKKYHDVFNNAFSATGNVEGSLAALEDAMRKDGRNANFAIRDRSDKGKVDAAMAARRKARDAEVTETYAMNIANKFLDDSDISNPDTRAKFIQEFVGKVSRDGSAKAMEHKAMSWLESTAGRFSNLGSGDTKKAESNARSFVMRNAELFNEVSLETRASVYGNGMEIDVTEADMARQRELNGEAAKTAVQRDKLKASGQSVVNAEAAYREGVDNAEKRDDFNEEMTRQKAHAEIRSKVNAKLGANADEKSAEKNNRQIGDFKAADVDAFIKENKLSGKMPEIGRVVGDAHAAIAAKYKKDALLSGRGEKAKEARRVFLQGILDRNKENSEEVLEKELEDLGLQLIKKTAKNQGVTSRAILRAAVTETEKRSSGYAAEIGESKNALDAVAVEMMKAKGRDTGNPEVDQFKDFLKQLVELCQSMERNTKKMAS